MDDATQHVPPLDRATSRWPQLSYRTLLVNALMRTSVIEIGNVFLQYPLEMPLIQNQQVVVLLSAMVDNSDLPVALDCGLSFRRFGTHDVP